MGGGVNFHRGEFPHGVVDAGGFPALWDKNAFVEKQLLATEHTTDWFIEFSALVFVCVRVCVREGVWCIMLGYGASWADVTAFYW